MNCYNKEDVVFEQVDRASLLSQYFRLLDKSFDPELSSYVNIDLYADKLIKNAHVSVLKYKGVFTGLLAIYLNNDNEKIAYLSSIAVLDKYKGSGLSQLLFDEAIRLSKECNMKVFKLEVKSSYTRAIHFYEKNGFSKSLEKAKDEDSFYMSKSLINCE